MPILLKKNGNYLGDKSKNIFPNLKLGEYRYYIQDNPNMYQGSHFKSLEDFKLLFEIYFPDYEVMLKKSNPNQIENHYVYTIEKIIKKDSPSIIAMDNKGYVCIREATKDYDGLCFYILDGNSYIYKEKYLLEV